LENNILT